SLFPLLFFPNNTATTEIYTLSLHDALPICSKVTKEFEVLDKRLYKTKPKSLVLASGRLYKINYEINKPPINAGKYVEVITFGKRSEEHTSELQSRENLVCRLLLEKKKTTIS